MGSVVGMDMLSVTAFANELVVVAIDETQVAKSKMWLTGGRAWACGSLECEEQWSTNSTRGGRADGANKLY